MTSNASTACWSNAVTKTTWLSIPLGDDAPRHVEPVEAGHLDVEEDHVRPQPLQLVERFDAVLGLAGHGHALDLPELEAQLVTRQLLVVDDQRSQFHGRFLDGPVGPSPDAPPRSRVRGRGHSGISHRAHRSRVRAARQLELVVGAVGHAAAARSRCSGRCRPSSALLKLRLGHPEPVVRDLDDEMAALPVAARA